MLVSNFAFVIFDNVKWPLNTTCICKKSNFFSSEISHNWDFPSNSILSPQSLEMMVQLTSITCATNPVTIDEDFCHSFVLQVFCLDLIEFKDTSILQFMDDFCSITSNRNQSHESQILN